LLDLDRGSSGRWSERAHCESGEGGEEEHEGEDEGDADDDGAVQNG
jgi:hypothetical protein